MIEKMNGHFWSTHYFFINTVSKYKSNDIFNIIYFKDGYYMVKVDKIQIIRIIKIVSVCEKYKEYLLNLIEVYNYYFKLTIENGLPNPYFTS